MESMELTRCPSSLSSPSKAPSSFSPAHLAGNVNRSMISNISGRPSCHCGITQHRGLCHLPYKIHLTSVLKLSPKLSFRVTLARREGFGKLRFNPHLGERFCSPLLAAGRLRVEKAWLGSRQGRSQDRIVSPYVCKVKFDSEQDVDKGEEPGIGIDEEAGQLARGVGQIGCWVVATVYVVWLFILPYAPGDPVWGISPSTIQMLIDLSLNFFFVLPLASSLTDAVDYLPNLLKLLVPHSAYNASGGELDRAAGFHGLTAPVLHPTAEALFNIVIGWTLLFAPLLFTDRKRDRFGGSLETLWIVQMFLTNTVLAPYMAIRLNSSPADRNKAPRPPRINLEVLSRGMTKGAHVIGIAGAVVGLISILWGFIGRPEGNFGGLGERWEYFLNYVGNERLAYAFLWDIALYTFFQPWLIGDNLDNVRVDSRETVHILRFVPYVGLVAYVVGLQIEDRPQGVSTD